MVAVTEVSFYHLQRQGLEIALSRLLERVLAAGKRAVVLAGSKERVAALNAALWTGDANSFLPHGAATDGYREEQPVYLTCEEENPAAASVLVVVDGVTPAYVGGFERCLDLFDGNDTEAVEAARARWRAYKDSGHEVTYWQQSPEGKWQRKD